jgi:hypothetical protein
MLPLIVHLIGYSTLVFIDSHRVTGSFAFSCSSLSRVQMHLFA